MVISKRDLILLTGAGALWLFVWGRRLRNPQCGASDVALPGNNICTEREKYSIGFLVNYNAACVRP